MSTTVHGFIIKKVSYSEKDLIVTIFSKEFSKLTAIGIAAKKSKKRNLNLLDYFNFLKISINSKKKYPLKIIENVQLIENLSPCPISPQHILSIQIINEIVNILVYGVEENLSLFSLYIETLKRLRTEKDEKLLDIITFFKIKSLQAIGFKLSPEKCIICGKDGNFLNYSIEKMGFVCNNCAKNFVKINLGTVKTINAIENRNIKFTAEIVKDIDKIFYINLSHLRDKSQIKNLIKLENYFNKWILKN